MEEDLLAYLLADAGLSSLVPNRVFWVRRPQGSPLPAIVLTRISRLPDYTLSGPSDMTQSRIQADCYADSYGRSKAVVRALVARMSGARVKHGATTFQSVFVDGERDSFETTDAGERLFRCSTDLILHHS